MGEWRMRVRDGGVWNESEGWGKWRMRVRDREENERRDGEENESEGWGSGE